MAPKLSLRAVFAIPQLYHDNVMIAGDCAGFYGYAQFKRNPSGYSIQNAGGEAAFESIKKNDASLSQLALYEGAFPEKSALSGAFTR